MNNISDLPVLNDFIYDDEGNLLDAAAAPEPPALIDIEVPELFCEEGWVVEMVHPDLNPSVSPAVIGAAVFVAHPRLRDVLEAAGAKHQELIAGGYFDIAGGSHVNVSLVPNALGLVVDADGNPVQVSDLAESTDDSQGDGQGGAAPAQG